MAAVTVYSAPEDGRKGRPKHVQHTCSFLINTILPELHLVGLLYIIHSPFLRCGISAYPQQQVCVEHHDPQLVSVSALSSSTPPHSLASYYSQ